MEAYAEGDAGTWAVEMIPWIAGMTLGLAGAVDVSEPSEMEKEQEREFIIYEIMAWRELHDDLGCFDAYADPPGGDYHNFLDHPKILKKCALALQKDEFLEPEPLCPSGFRLEGVDSFARVLFPDVRKSPYFILRRLQFSVPTGLSWEQIRKLFQEYIDAFFDGPGSGILWSMDAWSLSLDREPRHIPMGYTSFQPGDRVKILRKKWFKDMINVPFDWSDQMILQILEAYVHFVPEKKDRV